MLSDEEVERALTLVREGSRLEGTFEYTHGTNDPLVDGASLTMEGDAIVLTTWAVHPTTPPYEPYGHRRNVLTPEQARVALRPIDALRAPVRAAR